MPQFEYQETDPDSAGGSAVLGAMGAIPGLNFFTPAILEGQGNKRRIEAENAMARNAAAIQTPTFLDPYTGEYEYTGDFNPEMLADPELAQAALAHESPEARAAQLEALESMSELTDQSVGSKSALRRQQAEMDARQLAQSREGAIRQDAARRGRIGGPADMLSRQQAAQAAANQNLNAGLQNANLAALEELAGEQAKAGVASSMRGQDQALAFNNADALNRFNLFNTGAKNAAAAANTGMRNDAQRRNLDARQEVGNQNVGLGMAKTAMANANNQQKFNNQMTKYGAADDVLTRQAYGGQKQAKDQRSAGAQGWENTKDVYEMVMSFMGGGMGGK